MTPGTGRKADPDLGEVGLLPSGRVAGSVGWTRRAAGSSRKLCCHRVDGDRQPMNSGSPAWPGLVRIIPVSWGVSLTRTGSPLGWTDVALFAE